MSAICSSHFQVGNFHLLPRHIDVDYDVDFSLQASVVSFSLRQPFWERHNTVMVSVDVHSFGFFDVIDNLKLSIATEVTPFFVADWTKESSEARSSRGIPAAF